MEQYANGAQTTLNGDISNSDLSLVVTSASGFPTGASFRLIIGSEIIIVGGVSGTTFSSLTRGAEGTSATSHSSGATVSCILTRDSLLALPDRFLRYDTFANRATAGQAGGEAGAVHLASDGVFASHSNGSVWRPFGPAFQFTAPVSGDYSWVNQGSATISTTAGGILMTFPNNGGSANTHAMVKTIPTAPYTITVALIPTISGIGSYSFAGVVWRQSSDGKQIVVGVGCDGGAWRHVGYKMNGPTSYNTTTHSHNAFNAGVHPYFMQVADDNSNRYVRFSCDGHNFVELFSEARTTFLTADQIGFGGYHQNTIPAYAWFVSWKET